MMTSLHQSVSTRPLLVLIRPRLTPLLLVAMSLAVLMLTSAIGQEQPAPSSEDSTADERDPYVSYEQYLHDARWLAYGWGTGDNSDSADAQTQPRASGTTGDLASPVGQTQYPRVRSWLTGTIAEDAVGE